MAALERFDRFNEKISGWMEWIGFAGIVVIILVTTIDVMGSKLFVKPLFGALDIVMLAQLIAATCTVTAALIAGRHVRVDFFLDIMPKRLRRVVDGIVYFLAFVLFAIIVWRLARLCLQSSNGWRSERHRPDRPLSLWLPGRHRLHSRLPGLSLSTHQVIREVTPKMSPETIGLLGIGSSPFPFFSRTAYQFQYGLCRVCGTLLSQQPSIGP